MTLRLKDKDALVKFWNSIGSTSIRFSTIGPDSIIFHPDIHILFNTDYDIVNREVKGYNIRINGSSTIFLYDDEVVTEKELHDSHFNDAVDDLLK